MANRSGVGPDSLAAGVVRDSVVAFDATALVYLVTGLIVGCLGVAFSVREGRSRSAIPFFVTASFGAAWLVLEAVARSAASTSAAIFTYQLALICAAMTPAGFLWFTHKVTGNRRRTDWALRIAAVLAGAQSIALLWPGTIAMRSGLPAFGAEFMAVGASFTAYFTLVMAACAAAYATQLRRHGDSDYRHRRARLLLVASLVGTACGVGFAPSLGVAFYVNSALVAAIFFALVAYVIARYRVSDITPGLVGTQIARIMPDALLVLDRDAIVRQMNPAAEALFAVEARDTVGRPVRQLLGRDRLRKPIAAMVEGRAVTEFELGVSDPEGNARTVSVSATAVREFDTSPRAFVFILRDISTRKAAEERIRELAYHDSLTALPNRSGFLDEMSHRIEERRVKSAAILFLDLDRFKLVNDTLGHDAGDKMLAVVARRLQHSLRQDTSSRTDSDTIVARFGGDEFVVALCDVDDIERIVSVCQRILQTLAQPIDLGGQEVFSGASIGVSRFPGDGTNLQTLLKCADLALYEAKDDGRNAYQIYDETLARRSTERAQLEADIRLALERNDFHVHYQPIVDYRTRRIVGAEALLRWQHPRRGNVPPDVFVPVAEEIGVMTQLGERVLIDACASLRRWRELGFRRLSMAINLSDHQFRRVDLPAQIQQAMADHALDSDRIIVELTEGIIMNDAAFTHKAVQSLKEVGVRIGVDDFGTGYSSFHDLKQLGVDMIKVDGRFTRSMADQDSDGSVARAIIRMAQSLNLQVIAEGVENKEQAERLTRAQCHFMQGYLHGAPMTAEDFAQLLVDEQVADQPEPTLTLPSISLSRH